MRKETETFWLERGEVLAARLSNVIISLMIELKGKVSYVKLNRVTCVFLVKG